MIKENRRKGTAPSDFTGLLRRDQRVVNWVAWFARPFSLIFRYQVLGIENLKQGPYLLVANHNIGAPFEVLALLRAWELHYGGRRAVFALAHRFPFRIWGVAHLFRSLGAVPSTFEAAHQVLDAGHSLAIFPGGNFEAIRPFWQRHHCDLGGHLGWARIALSRNVQVVPVSIVGSHSINPVLFRARWLSWVLIVPKLLGIRWYPITIGQIVYAGIAWRVLNDFGASVWTVGFGVYLVFLISVMWPIFPAQIRIRAGTPFDLSEYLPASAETGIGKSSVRDGIDPVEHEHVQRAYFIVSQIIQEGMDSLLGKPVR